MTFHKFNKSDVDDIINTQICVGYLENHEIQNKTARALMENITEHMVMETYIDKLPQVFDNDIQTLLSRIFDAEYQFAVVVKVGNELTNMWGMLQDYFMNDYQGEKVVGHIVDEELHPQFFIIDVKWWDSVGRPEFGKTWIALAEKDTGFAQVSDSILFSQKYFYPEVEKKYVHEVSEILNQAQTEIFFCANTETVSAESVDEQMDIIAISAGALSPWIHAYVHNLKPQGVLFIYDISSLALQIQHDIYNTWDGTNYEQWLTDWAEKHPYLKGNLISPHRVKEYSEWVDNLDGFSEWWKTVVQQKQINVHLHKLNLLNPRHFCTRLHNSIYPGCNIMLHTSNIFMYHKTSWLLNYNDRWQLWHVLKNTVNIWKKRDGANVIDRIMFNDFNRKIMEILPWYKPFIKER